jgi:hypothetical protein
MEPGGTAEAADLKRILIAKPAVSRVSTTGTHTRELSLRRESGEVSLGKISGCEVASVEATVEIKASGGSSTEGATTSGSTVEAIPAFETDTGATNLYPMRGTVSTKRGLSATSFSRLSSPSSYHEPDHKMM